MEFQKAAKLAIANVIKEGLTDIFDRPFEVELLKKPEFAKKVELEIIRSLKGNSLESLAVNEIDHVLLPKNSAFNFRRCALIHPMDTLKYLALVLTLAPDIERARIPLQRKKIYSYRFGSNKGYLFHRGYTISSFMNKTRERSQMQKTKFVVSCDIANYYDRLNLHRLENMLLSINCDKSRVKLINELLLFWSGRDSYGLPVGSNASRILAEANLIGVDNYLDSMGIDFLRFVDDYRMFAPDAHTAHYWLTLLIERLWLDGLTINMGKTKIELKQDIIKPRIEEKQSNQNKEKSANQKRPPMIRAGYGGTVPTKFRNLSAREQATLVKNDLPEMIGHLQKQALVESDQYIALVKTLIAKSEYNLLPDALGLSEKYLQLTPYVIDAIIKHSSLLNDAQKNQVKSYFSGRLQSQTYVPEYLLISYVRLLGHDDFAEKQLLMRCFRQLQRNAGAYIGRALLDSLEGLVNREDVIEIRRGFKRADLWEKRQIIRMTKRVLEKDEQAAWLRNIKHVESSELFLQETAHPTQKKGKSPKVKTK